MCLANKISSSCSWALSPSSAALIYNDDDDDDDDPLSRANNLSRRKLLDGASKNKNKERKCQDFVTTTRDDESPVSKSASQSANQLCKQCGEKNSTT